MYFVDAVQSCLCMLTLESECSELAGLDDGHICGITRSALFCLTEEMRLILSSSVQITERTNLPINTLIHLQWWVCVCVCVCFTQWGTGVLHVAYVVHMHCFLLGLGGSDLMHMCRIIPSQWMCVCVSLHSTVIISMSVFDGSLHTEHMDAYTYTYLVSSVCVCVCVCVCALTLKFTYGMCMCALRRLCLCFCHLFFWVGG